MRDFTIWAGILLAAGGPSLVNATSQLTSDSAATSVTLLTPTPTTVSTKLPPPASARTDCFRSIRRFRVPPPLPTSSEITTTGSLSAAISESTGIPSHIIMQHKWFSQMTKSLPGLTSQSAAAASLEPLTTATPTTNTVASYTNTTTTAKPTQTSGVPVKCIGKKCLSRPGQRVRCGPKRPSSPKRARIPKKPKNTKTTTSSRATVTVTRTAVPSSGSQAAVTPSATPAVGKTLAPRLLEEPGADVEGLKVPVSTRTRPTDLKSRVAHTMSKSKRELPVQSAHAADLKVNEEGQADTTLLAVAYSTPATTSSPGPTIYSRRRCTRTRRPNCCSQKTTSTSSSVSTATPSGSSTSSSIGPVTVTVTITPSATSTLTLSTASISTSSTSTSTSTSTSSSPANRVTVTVTVTATPEHTPTYILNPAPTRAFGAHEDDSLRELPPVIRTRVAMRINDAVSRALKKQPKTGTSGKPTGKVLATKAPKASQTAQATKKI
ncbi:uncharacterized protein ColSpa_11426 [Colletotrichum spaethianum]|uniref:Uncharacterized protein n=1 Tax=Colletotrichum spaethianum TaxID=700344 RepID=A0AA37PFB9_9PEZI|nr:uncharacterized protein ColSpa_11426 [Colletotrichum spaethianum]GKT51245.1 hypothetical protein ColSpa_11426 [Colletotrichum spaethianum]